MISDTHRLKILSARKSERPLVITSHTFLPAAQVYVDQLLGVFLEELGVPYLFDQLSFCVRELAVNAKKANTKRLYFEDRGFDLLRPDDYAKGMATFKSDTLADQPHYIARLKEQNLYVKIEFLKWQNTCSVAVRNNVLALPAEVARVHEKVEKARNYESVQDALAEVLDESEGAGLGILFLVLMLKKVGFSGDFFQFYTVGGETVARIILPLTLD